MDVDLDVDTRTTASQLSSLRITFSAFSHSFAFVFLHTKIWCIEIRFPFCWLQTFASSSKCTRTMAMLEFPVVAPHSWCPKAVCTHTHSLPITISRRVFHLTYPFTFERFRLNGTTEWDERPFSAFSNEANAHSSQLWVIYPVTYILWYIVRNAVVCV